MLRIGLLTLLLLQPLLGADQLYDSFRNPPAEARPFVRWWWNGGRVNEAEIVREIELLKQAGIGGFEINTIAMLEAVPKDSLDAFPAINWLSPEWNRMVRTAAEAARQRGMIADLIVGSGWPFGGRFLAPTEQTQRVSIIKKEIVGPTVFQSDVKTLMQERKRRGEEAATESRIVFLKLVPRHTATFDPGVNLMTSLSPSGSMNLQIPKGEYVLYVGLWEEGFTHVKLGAPGADGPVVNHFDAQAVRKYLDNMSTRLGPDLGGRLGNSIRAAFVDSLELDHANCTSDFPTEFEKRRGYSCWPYLPFILDPEVGKEDNALGDTVRRARYDFCRTLVELFHERFVQTYVSWCHENGIKARIQAYGRETHPLGGSMLVDLPEGESWLWGEEDRIVPSPTVVNKYVSSAAHLTGKHQVSFEAMTNAVPVFRETLQDFKLCYDMSLMSGVIHPVVHGFNYNPPEAGFPGWVRFGCYLNEKNPWWPHFRHWTDYASRLSSVLLQSDAQASVAILGPRADEWSRDFLLYQPFPEVARPWYHYHLWQSLNQLGISSDFMSEEVLQKAIFDGGHLKSGGRSYDVLILQDVESLEPETAAALEKFVQAGGRLAFVGQVPSRNPGLKNAAARDAVVKSTVDRIVRSTESRVCVVPAPTTGTALRKDFVRMGLGDQDRRALLQWTREFVEKVKLESDIRITSASADVMHVHHRQGDRDILLFSNSNRTQAADIAGNLAWGGKKVWKWDPETGERSLFAGFWSPAGFKLHLEPAESILLVFEPGEKGGKTIPARASCPCGKQEKASVIQPISGWQAEFRHVIADQSFTRSLGQLPDISRVENDAPLSTFAGRVIYRAQFESQSGKPMWLDLGQVYDASEVRLNGKSLGVRWWGRHVYPTGGALRKGHNQLEVEVTTMLGNYIKSLAPVNPVAKRWAYWFPPIPAGLVGPVRLVEGKGK